MNLKEHLQFLAMMIPTLLLMAAAAASLAFPAGTAGASASLVAVVQSDSEMTEDVAQNTGMGSADTPDAR